MKEESLFASLPGLETPVDSLHAALSRLWSVDSDEGHTPPSEFRASQMNLIIHLGLDATASAARRSMESALRFAQRYPCRIIILCSEKSRESEFLISSKIFGECYIGKSRREMSCCEVLILGYPPESRSYLENQVSILLENDLPTYYWLNQFSSGVRMTDYTFFLTTCKRALIDSSIESNDPLEIDWPFPEKMRDLAAARILPVRQSIGQFMSNYPPEVLARDLRHVDVAFSPNRKGEAASLLRWFGERIADCAEAGGETLDGVGFELSPVSSDEVDVLRLTAHYDNDYSFFWGADCETGESEIRADLGRGDMVLPLKVQFLAPEAALAEAFFF